MTDLQSLRSSVERYRALVSRHAAERDAALAAPVDPATAAARIDAEIAAAQASVGKFFAFLGSARNEFSPARFNEHMARDAFSFFAAFDPDRLREMALEKVGIGGLTYDERAERVSGAEAALQESEIAEELALRQLDELIGRHEPRRPDAQPAILLAPLAELRAAAKPPKAKS